MTEKPTLEAELIKALEDILELICHGAACNECDYGEIDYSNEYAAVKAREVLIRAHLKGVS